LIFKKPRIRTINTSESTLTYETRRKSFKSLHYIRGEGKTLGIKKAIFIAGTTTIPASHRGLKENNIMKRERRDQDKTDKDK
jgi:hypothetical protein